MESPAHETIPTFLDGNFSLSCTYHRRSDIPCLYGSYRTYQHVKDNEHTYFNYSDILKLLNIKEKLVLWMYSNCKPRFRQAFANLLLKKGVNIDIYGHCTKKDPCNRDPKCLISLYKKYKFYLSFENSYCYDYITEKAWKSLMYGMVPVVDGAPMESYSYLLPPNSYLHVDNFSNVQELSEYIQYLHRNNDAYLKYHEWRKHFVATVDKSIATTCAICNSIFERRETNFREKSKWWKFEIQCKNK